ncbi:MAG: right-handed parallel beta-helix repeat-containing protein [Cyanobacteria bacterium P01_A01_bin.80]
MNDVDATPINNSVLGTDTLQLAPEYGLMRNNLWTQSISGGNILRYEAEDLQLTDYQIESNIVSSGSEHISVGTPNSTGTATGVFNGPAGIYQVKLGYYDENDGVSPVSVTVDGNTQSFSFDQDLGSAAAVSKTFTERITHSTIQLTAGDTFGIEGEYKNGERARIDYIDFVLTELQPETIRYEAEDLTLSNFQSESNSVSSGNKNIRIPSSSSGTATGTFNGPTGIYEVKVAYYDENDGVASAGITVAGDTQNFLLDQDLGSGGPVAATLTERITHGAIALQQGESFEIASLSDGSEYARFDYIEFKFLEFVTQPGASVRYEVEDLELINFGIESREISSEGENVTLLGTGTNFGIAKGVFNGPTGIYDVKVAYYDENDGVAPASVTVAGNVTNFSFDQDLGTGAPTSTTLTERTTHSSIRLEDGDTFELEGESNFGEPLRFDRIEFIYVEPAPDQDVVYEAEDLQLTNFEVESNIFSSGDEHVAQEAGSSEGIATGTFDGPAGIYQVKVSYYDENDGVSSADVTVNGDTQSFLFDQNLGSGGPELVTLTERITHEAMTLQQGDNFEIAVQRNDSEEARIDKIEFILVNSHIPTTYYVSSNGDDSNPGTEQQPWKTINHAVSKFSAVKAGDTVLVQPGVYTELITLNKSGNPESGHITLKANGNVTLRDPDPIVGNFREGVIQSANRGYWIIDGFRIENTSWAGISLRNANNMIVQNNHTYETGASGIIVMPDQFFGGGENEVTSKDIKVLGNTIERANWRWTGSGDSNGTQEALSIWGVDGFEVANNTVNQGTREGIDAKVGSRNGSIHNNTVTGVASISGTPQGYNGGPAIYVDGNRADSFNIDIYNNLVYENNSEGIVIADEFPSIGDVKDIRVYNNVIYDNGILGVNAGAGIVVTSNVNDIEIINNTVVNNVQSIMIDGTDFFGGYTPFDILVRNNIFANPRFRNGLIEDANNVILDNNLFTDESTLFYEGGTGLTITETNNSQVADIGFLDVAANNYRLSSSSAAIDIGSDLIPNYASIDKDGIQRDEDGNDDGVPEPDVGAYEFVDSI